MKYEDIITAAYNGFNRRDIASVLQYFHPDVEWPNGWEGGYVYGHEAVRDYWTRQWKELDPTVIPLAFTARDGDTMEVSVKQHVKDKTGAVVFDGTVKHTYTFSEGLVTKMVIGEA